MAKESRAEVEIRRRMDEHADDMERFELLRRAGLFKRSWVELGEVLSAARQESSFDRWGFNSFVEYCRTELHLRRATVDKLTASFGYLAEHAPHVLQRDGISEMIPQPDTVHALARAKQAERVPDKLFEAIQADVFSEDVSPSSLARKFKEAIGQPKSTKEGDKEHAVKAVSLARKLADLLADMEHALPGALAADVEEQLGRLIGFLDDSGSAKRR